MPMYEFSCKNCKYTFEKLTTFKEAENVICPECGEEKCEKLMSLFSSANNKCNSPYPKFT